MRVCDSQMGKDNGLGFAMSIVELEDPYQV